MRRDDIRRLTEQRKSVFAQMHKLNEDAEKENRSLSGEESEQFDKLATEFEELKDREDRATKLFVQEREVEKMSSTPIEKRIGDPTSARRRTRSTGAA
jgi:predicted phage gp36 major capsid-like protein